MHKTISLALALALALSILLGRADAQWYKDVTGAARDLAPVTIDAVTQPRRDLDERATRERAALGPMPVQRDQRRGWVDARMAIQNRQWRFEYTIPLVHLPAIAIRDLEIFAVQEATREYVLTSGGRCCLSRSLATTVDLARTTDGVVATASIQCPDCGQRVVASVAPNWYQVVAQAGYSSGRPGVARWGGQVSKTAIEEAAVGALSRAVTRLWPQQTVQILGTQAPTMTHPAQMALPTVVMPISEAVAPSTAAAETHGVADDVTRAVRAWRNGGRN